MLPSKGKFEFNLNTVLQLITLCGMFSGGVYVWFDTTRDIEELEKWRTGHEQLHKERLVEVKGVEARYDERLKSVESDVRKLGGITDNLSYRITTNEQATLSVAQSNKETQGTLSQLGGDMRVVKEILQRIEAGQKRGGR
ncbi:hypothetical protein ACLBWS_05640 [Brucellaceae bacterium D45D]